MSLSEFAKKLLKESMSAAKKMEDKSEESVDNLKFLL